MPSFEHEQLVELLREHPELVLQLARVGLGDVGGALEVLPSTENLTEIKPPERRADLVLVVRNVAGDSALRAFVVEVQLHPDAKKRWSWPAYVAVLRARLCCAVDLIVLTLDDATARWCAAPIELDDRGSCLLPLVIGPRRVPIVDRERARRHPELGLLSVLAHRTEPIAFELAWTFLLALEDLDDERAGWYADVVLSFVGDAVRRALEAEMNLDKYEFRSEYFRKLKADAIARGQAEGVAQGRAEGVAQGRAEGVAQGEIGGLQRALLTVLDTRQIPIDDEARARVHACLDRAQLEAWLVRAVSVATAAALFGA